MLVTTTNTLQDRTVHRSPGGRKLKMTGFLGSRVAVTRNC